MKNAKVIVAENLNRLMERHGDANDRLSEALQGTIGHGTIARIRNAQGNCKLDSLETLASHYKLQAWQMLIEDMDPERPPEAAMQASRQAKLIARRFDLLLTDDESRRKAYAIILQVIELGAADLDDAGDQSTSDDHPKIQVDAPQLAQQPKPLPRPSR